MGDYNTSDGTWSIKIQEPILDHNGNNDSSVYGNEAHAAFFASLSIIIGVLAIIGNILVFVAVSFSKKLQTATNAFVVNLSVSDFLNGLTLPLQSVGMLSQTGWPLADWLCKVIAVLFVLSNGTSIFTLTAIAINRYITITKTKRIYQKVYTRQNIVVILVSSWLAAFPFPLLQLIPATGGLGYNTYFRTCIWDLDHDMAMITNAIVAVVLMICSVIIFLCYGAIYKFVQQHVAGTQARIQAAASTESLDMDSSTHQKSSSSNCPSIKQINITKNLASVVVVFLVCVLPYSLNLLVLRYSILTAYLAVLVVLPSCLNPFIYAAKHPHFKVVFKCMFCCKLKDIPQPSAWLKSILHYMDVTFGSSGNSSSSN